MKFHLSGILQGSGRAAMGRASTWVDVDGIVCVLYIFEESEVAEYMHLALISKENPVWIQASGVVVRVVRDLVKACTWRGLGVVVVFVVRLGVVFCLSVALIRFMVNVHTWYACCDAVDSLNDVVRAATLFLQFFLFVSLEWTWSAIVDDLAALVACDVLVYYLCSFAFYLLAVLPKR